MLFSRKEIQIVLQVKQIKQHKHKDTKSKNVLTWILLFYIGLNHSLKYSEEVHMHQTKK